jgi:hypothetical protein
MWEGRGGVLRDPTPTNMPKDSTANQHRNEPFPVAPASSRGLRITGKLPALRNHAIGNVLRLRTR